MQLPKSSQPPRGLLPKGSVLHGDLQVAQGIRIEGQVQGQVRATDGEGATVVVAEEAVVMGSIEASHVIVLGQVLGPIVAHEQLQLCAGAQVEGELHYRHLDLHPQALVRGSLVPMLGMGLVEPPAEAAREDESVAEAAADKGPSDDAGNAAETETARAEAVPSAPNPA